MLYTKDKRKYTRLAVYHLVKYRLVSRPGKELAVASIKDIGGGGVLLLSADTLTKGDILQMFINFPHILSPVPCLAKVVWIKKISKANRFEAGVQFLEIEDFLRQKMINLIDQTRAGKR